MTTAVQCNAIDALRAAVDRVLGTDLAMLTGAQLADWMSALEVERRRLEAADVQAVSAALDHGLAAERGATSVPDLIGGLARVSRGEARARAQRAVDLGPRRAVSGESLVPIHPLTAAALRAGEISGAHVDVITRYLGRIPAGIALDTVDGPDGARSVFELAESYLVEAARHEDPAALRRSGDLLLARLDPDGAEPREDEQERARQFGFGGRQGPNAVCGQFTTETKAVWQAILDSLAAPRPGADGEPDPRTAGQRNHDALLEAGLRLLRSGTLPATGGVPVSVIVRIDAADLERARLGEPGAVAQTAHGDLISAERLLRLAGEAELTEVVVAAMGGILDYGRTRRLACADQRRALTARDGGCCFPACTRPAAWCEAHHVRAWIRGGRTSLDNLCLLCSHHHRSFEKAGWTVAIVDGAAQWTPPAWLDPSRRPRRNTAHHLPDISFAL